MKNKLKALLRLDLTMWSVLIIVIVCIASIIYAQIAHEQKETAEKSNRIHQISQHAKSILATNPDFKIPEVNTSSYIKMAIALKKFLSPIIISMAISTRLLTLSKTTTSTMFLLRPN